VRSAPADVIGCAVHVSEVVLIMQDPDAPLPRPVVHLIATGIPPECSSLSEGALSPAASRTINFGRGSFGRIGYAGPRPVRGHGVHRYLFQIFALAERLAVHAQNSETLGKPRDLCAAAIPSWT
jgi:phosphatidylethanolamine-binding protein (PEBP) family uncharacterized protein